jgi:hypothetical protein
MDNNAEGRQRAHRTPLVFPLLGEDLEVLRTDVDGVGSLIEGMTIVPSVSSVLSLPSVTTPTSTALVAGNGVLIKPAEGCQQVTRKLAELCVQCGVPSDLVQVDAQCIEFGVLLQHCLVPSSVTNLHV